MAGTARGSAAHGQPSTGLACQALLPAHHHPCQEARRECAHRCHRKHPRPHAAIASAASLLLRRPTGNQEGLRKDLQAHSVCACRFFEEATPSLMPGSCDHQRSLMHTCKQSWTEHLHHACFTGGVAHFDVPHGMHLVCSAPLTSAVLPPPCTPLNNFERQEAQESKHVLAESCCWLAAQCALSIALRACMAKKGTLARLSSDR